MKAIYISAYGGTEGIRYKEDALEPAVADNQVLVQNYAASINPFDAKLQAGYMKEFIPLNLPVIAGGDFAGTVVQTGKDVTGFTKGDEVFGSAMILSGGSGAFAEIVAAQAGAVAKKPKSIDFNTSAALVLVGVSAIQAIEDHLNLHSGQKILIHGGAGGIGQIAVQLAKSKGAYVATTASGADADFVKGLGADLVIDYKEQKFEEIIKDYDGVYDTVGGDTLTESYGVLKKGGTLVSMLGGQIDKEESGIVTIAQKTQVTTARLGRLAELVDEGKIKIHIAEILPLSDAAAAFTKQLGHPKGKIVLEIKK